MTCRISFPTRAVGDTYEPLIVHFEDKDGYPIPLGSVDHVQILGKLTGADSGDLLVNAAMTISDASNGVALYQLDSTHVDNAAELEFLFEIWHTATEKKTYPEGESVFMRIREF